MSTNAQLEKDLTQMQKLYMFEQGMYSTVQPTTACYVEWSSDDWVWWIDKHGTWSIPEKFPDVVNRDVYPSLQDELKRVIRYVFRNEDSFMQEFSLEMNLTEEECIGIEVYSFHMASDQCLVGLKWDCNLEVGYHAVSTERVLAFAEQYKGEEG